MIDLLAIPATAALNRLRGYTPKNKLLAFVTSKAFCSAYIGLVWAWVAGWQFGLCVALGVLLWAIWGWGKYFIMWHGWEDVYWNETEIGWLERLADKLVGIPDTHAEYRRWGLVAMTLRGTFIAPMFIALAFVATPWALLIGLPITLGQGALYWPAGPTGKHRELVAELIYGLALGVTLWGVAYV